MKSVLLLTGLFISLITEAQSSDFILLKKRGKTIETYYAGTHIAFTSNTGAYRDALIEKIRNDTLYLREFITQYLPTTFGTYILDTLGSYHFAYHYNQVAVIGRKESRSFNMRGSGAALFGGGSVLVLASGVVFLVDRARFSAPLLIASAALAVAGYFMMKGKSSGITIGRKYRLVYMGVAPVKK